MNKFNLPLRNLLKDRRAKRSQRKRLRSGNSSNKLTALTPVISISGKKKRQQLKKWRRAQKEALDSGLVTMQDIEMILTDNIDLNQQEVQQNNQTSHHGLRLKKRAKLRLKKLNKLAGKTNIATKLSESDGDAVMQE